MNLEAGVRQRAARRHPGAPRVGAPGAARPPACGLAVLADPRGRLSRRPQAPARLSLYNINSISHHTGQGQRPAAACRGRPWPRRHGPRDGQAQARSSASPRPSGPAGRTPADPLFIQAGEPLGSSLGPGTAQTEGPPGAATGPGSSPRPPLPAEAEAARSAQTQTRTWRGRGSGSGGPPAVPSLPRAPSSARVLAPGPGPPRLPRSRHRPRARERALTLASGAAGRGRGLAKVCERGSGPRRPTGQPSPGLLSAAAWEGPWATVRRSRRRARDPWVPAVTVTVSCPSVPLARAASCSDAGPHAAALPAGDRRDLKQHTGKLVLAAPGLGAAALRESVRRLLLLLEATNPGALGVAARACPCSS